MQNDWNYELAKNQVQGIDDYIYVNVLSFDAEEWHYEDNTNAQIVTKEASLDFDYFGITEDSKRYEIELTEKQYDKLWRIIYKNLAD